jgi:hypothetical protein
MNNYKNTNHYFHQDILNVFKCAMRFIKNTILQQLIRNQISGSFYI